MEGFISSIETVDGGYKLTVLIDKKRVKFPSGAKDVVKERREYYETKEYVQQVEEIEEFERSISLGRVEINYLNNALNK